MIKIVFTRCGFVLEVSLSLDVIFSQMVTTIVNIVVNSLHCLRIQYDWIGMVSKFSSLDVIFDAPSILFNLGQGEATKLTPNGFEVVIECKVGSQLLRSLVAFLVARHSIEEEVEVRFSGFCNSAVLLQAHLPLTIILATTVILVAKGPVREVRRELWLVVQIHTRSVPAPVPLLAIDGTGLP